MFKMARDAKGTMYMNTRYILELKQKQVKTAVNDSLRQLKTNEGNLRQDMKVKIAKNQ